MQFAGQVLTSLYEGEAKQKLKIQTNWKQTLDDWGAIKHSHLISQEQKSLLTCIA